MRNNINHTTPAAARLAEEELEARCELRRINEVDEDTLLEEFRIGIDLDDDDLDDDLDLEELPDGWEIKFDEGRVTGASTARIIDPDGDTRARVSYWEEWGDLAAEAWALASSD